MRRTGLPATFMGWACAALCLAMAPALRAFGDGSDSIVFIVTSDSHYVSSRNLDRIGRNKATIDRMNAIEGTP